MHIVVHSNHLLGDGCPVHHALAESHVRAGVAAHVIMYSKSTIDEPVVLVQIRCLKCQSQEFGPSYVSNESYQLLPIILIRTLLTLAQE